MAVDKDEAISKAMAVAIRAVSDRYGIDFATLVELFYNRFKESMEESKRQG